MAEYIERKALLQAILDLPPKMDEQGYGWLGRRGVWQMAFDFPAADVRPVVLGSWIDMGDFIKCSSCNATRLKEFESDYGKAMRLDARTNFCSNCGARMEES